jgi:hypothetical protein
MKAAYTNYYNMYRDARGVTNTTKRPGLMCHYAYISAYESAMGCWGLLDNLGQDTTTAPKYMATSEWMQANAKWWAQSDVCGTGVQPSSALQASRTAPRVVVSGSLLRVIGADPGALAVSLHAPNGRLVTRYEGRSGSGAFPSEYRWSLPSALAPGAYLVRVRMGSTAHESTITVR